MTGQSEHLGPGSQVQGEHDQFDPDLVRGKTMQGQVGQTGVLGGTDAIFGAGPAAMAQLLRKLRRDLAGFDADFVDTVHLCASELLANAIKYTTTLKAPRSGGYYSQMLRSWSYRDAIGSIDATSSLTATLRKKCFGATSSSPTSRTIPVSNNSPAPTVVAVR